METAKKVKPDIHTKILLTQGSYPENDTIIKAFPKEIKWVYYSGERFGTYSTRPINPITDDLRRFARDGYWLSLCCHVTGGEAIPTSFEQLHKNIGYAFEVGFKGMLYYGTAFPADKMGLFIASADNWNYAGRSLDETFRSYAATLNAASPERSMAAYKLYDKANHYVSFKNSASIGNPFGDFSRVFNMLERIKNNDKVDELMMHVADNMELDDIPAMSEFVAELKHGLSLCDPKEDRYTICAVATCCAT